MTAERYFPKPFFCFFGKEPVMDHENTTETVDTGVRFTVCGGVRFDAPFAGLTAESMRARRTAARASFSRMLSDAEDSGVSYILIAGDLFDADFLTGDTLSFVIAKAEEHTSLHFIIAPGKGEASLFPVFYASARLPQNMYVFSEAAPTRFDFPDVTFYGFCDKTDAPPLDERFGDMRAADDGKTHVLLCAAPYTEETAAVIRRFGADICVTGNSASVGMTVYENKPLIFTPGAMEGRSFDMPGFGGAVTVDVPANEEPSLVFHAYSARRYLDETVTLTDVGDSDTLFAAIKSYIAKSGYGEETFLRLKLEGILPPEFLLPDIGETFGLYGLSIMDDTLPLKGAEYLARDMSVRGELYRTLSGAFHSKDPEDRRIVAEAFRLGLAALDERDRK